MDTLKTLTQIKMASVGRALTSDEIVSVTKDWIKQWHNHWRETIQYEELYIEEVLPLLVKQLGLENISSKPQNEVKQV